MTLFHATLADIGPLGGWEWITNLTSTGLILLLYAYDKIKLQPKRDEEHRKEREAAYAKLDDISSKFITELHYEREQAQRAQQESHRAMEAIALSSRDALIAAHSQLEKLVVRVESLARGDR